MKNVKRQTRRQGHTRISSKNQVTIPVAVLREAGLEPGQELRVEAAEDGSVALTPVESRQELRLRALRETAGSLTGVYPPGYLERLRDEWR